MIFFLTYVASLSLATSSTATSFSSETPLAAASSAASSVVVYTYVSHQNMTYQGVLQNYRKYKMQQHLRSFHVIVAIEYDSKYKIGLFGVDVIVFPNVVLSKMDKNQMTTFFCAKLAMSCTKGAFLRSYKPVVKVIWDSCVSSISWLDVSLLCWIPKPLSTVLVIIIPTWVLVHLIWRILPGFRPSTTIASRTAKQTIKFVDRRGLFQVMINFSLSSFLYKNPIRVISRTVWWYFFYRVLLQK